MKSMHDILKLVASGVVGIVFSASAALAEPTPPTPAPTPTDTAKPAEPSGDKKGDDKKGDDKPKAIEPAALDDYRNAYRAIYERHDYAAGIAILRTLGRDDHADVANLIGFASRKLGRYEDAKQWYEKALAADPRHVRTWQYYGMWHAEQGNLLKAADFLDRIEVLCGGKSCKEYQDLKGAMDGTVTY